MRSASAGLALAGMLAIAGEALASYPPPNPDFRPYSTRYGGPGMFCLSGFSIQLAPDEIATVDQKTTWSNESRIDLHEGRIVVTEIGAGFTTGKHWRRAGEGWLIKVGSGADMHFRYDDGLPGTTEISFVGANSRRQADRVLARMTFVAPRVDVSPCIKGEKVQ